MALFCFIVLSYYLASRDITGSHRFVAASLSTQSTAKQSFLLTTGNGIVQFSPGYPKVTLLSELSNAVYLDILFLPKIQKTVVFWADTYENKIFRAFLMENKLVEKEVVVGHGLSSVSGLTVEWVGNNIYWSDKDYEQIEVSHWDGSQRTTLLDQLDSPTNLVIDPVKGFLFWLSEGKSDESGLPSIARSNLDGTDQWTVVSSQDELSRGHTYTISLFSEKQELYWLDTLTGSLFCSDYDGNDVRIIAKNSKATSVFAFTVTRDYIYWADKLSRILVKADYSDLDKVDTLTVTRPRIYDFKIISHHKQSGVIDVACASGNGGCTHLCLRGARSSTCKCPYGLMLADDLRTCKEPGPILGFVRKDKSDLLNLVSLSEPRKWIYPPLKLTNFQNGSLSFDPNAKKIYRIVNRNIVTSSMDGTSSKTVLEMGYFSPRCLAVDWRHGNLYIMSEREFGRGLVSVSTLTGASLNHLHWDSIGTPTQIVLDLHNLFLFWSHVHSGLNESELNVLEISQLNGNNRMLFYSSDDPITSVAADAESRRLCWLNPKRNSIFCRGYGPLSSVYSLQAETAGIITAIAIYQGKLLYANDLGQLYITDKSSSKETAILLNATSSLPYVAVIPSKTDQTRRANCDPNVVCLPDLRRASTNNHNKVDSYLHYTEDGNPHAFPVSMPDDYPELLPRPLFKVDNGDKVTVLPETNAQFFWVNQTDGALYSVRRDGTKLSKLYSPVGVVGGIEVDDIAENLYWSIPDRGQIWVSRIDGSHPFIIHAGKHDRPSILALTSQFGYLFWLSCDDHCTIHRSSLSGLHSTILLNDLKNVADLEVDGTWVYWTSPDLGVIQRSDFNGQHKELVIESDKSFSPFSLSVERGVVYWTDLQHGGGNIMKKNGSVISYLRRKVPARHLIFVNEVVDPIHFTGGNPCGADNGGCSQLCLYDSTNSKDLCYCSHGQLAPDRKSCLDYMSFLVFSNQNKLESVSVENPLDPNAPVAAINPLLNGTNIVALVYHPKHERIYFNDVYRKPYLFSIYSNGSGLRPELKESSRKRHIEGLALDPLEGSLLWTESFIPSIWSMTPRESPQMIVSLTAEDKPRGIALHHCSRRLFWTNWYDRQPGIETCSLDHCSTSREMFLPTHLRYPNALALQEEQLFWTETSSSTKDFSIHSCWMDGTHHKVHVRGADANPFALVVLPNQKMVWTDFLNKRVCLSRSDDSSVACQPVRTDLVKPMGLVLVNPHQHFDDCSGDHGMQTFSYGCIGRSCNYSEISFRNYSDDFVQTGDQYNSFHKQLFVGAGIAAAFLFSLTALLVFRWYYRRKHRNWCHLKVIAQKERSRHREVPSTSVNQSQSNSLLEMDNVAFQRREEQMDDEQWLILSKAKELRNVV